MRKEFTLKAYFKYLLRYWLVTAICAVIGLGLGITVGALTQKGHTYTYQGNICIDGISSLGGTGEAYNEIYSRIKNDAFDTMRSETVANAAYWELEADWREVGNNKKLSAAQARNSYNKLITVTESGPFVYVRFSVTVKGDADSYKTFGQKAINTYLCTAKTAAERREKLLADNNMLTITEAVEQIAQQIEGIGILKGGLIGVIVGIVAAAVAMLIVFIADRRIVTYGDIAEITGRKLLAVNKGRATNNVCPVLDVAISGNKVIAVCGDEESCRNLTQLYGEYASATGCKTLTIDFSRGVYGDDTFEKYVKGAALGECVTEKETDVLHGERSWALILGASERTDALKRTYGKIIICAPYYGDGSISVIAQAADKIVFAVNQSRDRIDTVVRLSAEADAADKTVGTVIDCAGRSFVGDDTYTFVPPEND